MPFCINEGAQTETWFFGGSAKIGELHQTVNLAT